MIKAISLKQANTFVYDHHRHHKEVVGHKYSIGLFSNEKLIGVCIVGRPVARALNHYETIEVTRLCVDGTKNACSKLYSAAARCAKELGYKKIQTYILSSEPGLSLKASGWMRMGLVKGKSWDCESRPRNQQQSFLEKDQPNEQDKIRYEKVFHV